MAKLIRGGQLWISLLKQSKFKWTFLKMVGDNEACGIQ